MGNKGRGWHDEPDRHSLAARGIPTKPIYQQAHTGVLDLAEYVADALEWHPDVTVRPGMLPRFERGIETILVHLETKVDEQGLALKTATGYTVKEELAYAREAYESSFTYSSTVDRFLALEEARERLHAITSKLVGIKRLGES